MGHEELLDAVAIHIPGRDAHARLRPTDRVERQPQAEGALQELPGRDLQPGEVGFSVVGHVDVGPAVLVEIAEQQAEALARARGDTGLGAHVAESSVALIVIEHVRHTGEALGAGKIGQAVVVQITGHEQIEEPVRVVIEEAGGSAPTLGRHSRRLTDLLEATVPGVQEQAVWAEAGHVEVEVAVVVEVSDRHPHAVALVSGPSPVGDGREATVRSLAIKQVCGPRPPAPSTHQVQIKVAVALEIEQGAATAHAVGHVEGARERTRGDAVEAHSGRPVHEPRARGRRRAPAGRAGGQQDR